MIVATSGVNFLVWALLGGDEGRRLTADVAYFFDAFSRSVGITLILVLGLMAVTHRYKPSVAGRRRRLRPGDRGRALSPAVRVATSLHVGPATFYLVVNVLTTAFLLYFTWRLWSVGATRARRLRRVWRPRRRRRSR